jgi:hypothetical protein
MKTSSLFIPLLILLLENNQCPRLYLKIRYQVFDWSLTSTECPLTNEKPETWDKAKKKVILPCGKYWCHMRKHVCDLVRAGSCHPWLADTLIHYKKLLCLSMYTKAYLSYSFWSMQTVCVVSLYCNLCLIFRCCFTEIFSYTY